MLNKRLAAALGLFLSSAACLVPWLGGQAHFQRAKGGAWGGTALDCVELDGLSFNTRRKALTSIL